MATASELFKRDMIAGFSRMSAEALDMQLQSLIETGGESECHDERNECSKMIAVVEAIRDALY